MAHVLPASFNNGTYSHLEGAKLQTHPKLTLANITKGTFQSQTEKWLTTKVPKRDSVMLFNAKMQRGVIKIANLTCEFETIPTFFGAKNSFTEKHNVLQSTSVQKTKEIATNYQSAARAINNFASKHPDLNMTLAIPDRISYSENNPTFSLTSNPIDTTFKNENFIGMLSTDIKYVNIFSSSTEEHLDDFFKTDHHWNIKGGAKAFNKVATEGSLCVNTLKVDNFIYWDQPIFYGSFSRTGLMTIEGGDNLIDYQADLEGVKIYINGKEAEQEDVVHMKLYTNKSFNKHLFTNRHPEYFHNRFAKLEFMSENHNGKQLLIVGDSYSNSIQRFFAKSYEKVVCLDHEYTSKAQLSLSRIMEENNFTDVLFLMNDEAFCKNDNQLIKLLES